MKQHYKYLILLVSFFACFLLEAQQTTFYYYKGEKFYLDVDYSRLSIVSNGEISSNKIKNKIAKYDFDIKNQKRSHTKQNIIATDKSNQIADIYNTEIEFSTKINSDEYLDNIQNLQNEDGVIKVSPTYTVRTKKLGVSNNFYVRLSKAGDVDILNNLAKKYSVQVLGYNQFMPLWYTLSCTKETPYNAIEAANYFYETNLFESSEPEFLYHDLAATNDPYFPNQWGLKNTGQNGGTSGIDIHAEQAWNITTGSSSIRVAVYDQGFEMNHPDLQNNVYGTGYDAETGTTPSIVRGNHGTPCAGIVGAQQNNSIGVSGVAPSTSLMSVSLDLSWFDTPQQIANGFNWAWQNGADVISNSWGGYNPSTIIEDAINNTLTNGRSGKGTVVVFAAGNENDTYIRYPGNSIPAILVVGAASPCGERKNPASCDGETWWGSCYGTQLDIVAPGVLIPTTDRQSSNGYNTSSGTAGDYVQTFNGTSSACPHVAGLAALILSRDPTLTVQQVSDIIESTAQKVGGYNYQTTSGCPNGTWNNEMGYGLIDAYAAVAAVCLTTFFEYQTVIANTNVSGCKVSIQDVSVTNNAMLTITSERETVINSIDVQLGSELEVN